LTLVSHMALGLTSLCARMATEFYLHSVLGRQMRQAGRIDAKDIRRPVATLRMTRSGPGLPLVLALFMRRG
jgi:hypothetical protein